MTPEELYQLADDELRLGIAEPVVWVQAQEEAKGVAAVAVQSYWRLRANGLCRRAALLSDAEADRLFEEFRSRIERTKHRNAQLRSVEAWTWIGIFVLSVIGNFAFGRMTAKAAQWTGPWVYVYGVLWLISSVGLVRSLIECRRLRQRPRF